MIKRSFLRFGADRSGVALLEFAITLPVVLTLGLYGTETANLALANLRLGQIAAATADNAGRAGAVSDPAAALDEADVNEVFAGAKLLGDRINFNQYGRIILSDLEPSSTAGRQWIRWQRCTGALAVSSSYGRPKSANGAIIADGSEMTTPSSDSKSTPTNGTVETPAGMGPVPRQIAASTGSAVMFVEAVYQYQPLVSQSLFGPITIRFNSAYNVRQRTDNRILNAGNMATTAKSTCNRYSS
ncbi:TadE/TadG family type IV pilus assembly protein [Sphingomonas sp. R86521]|uniref:TadE/TadG family type IV pilus assembly protein n=1 Tax=Sphingomonas sp. R86521 TaxID=3093860 RepID=UPI0036D208E1